MIDYRSQGLLPAKPHTAFRDAQGQLYHEECLTQLGFDGPFSILYHRHPPQDHGHAEAAPALWPAPREVDGGDGEPLRRRHLQTWDLPPAGTATTGRVPLMFNADVTVGFVRPDTAGPEKAAGAGDSGGQDDFYFANGDGDDCFYIHEGEGEVRSGFGVLPFGPGDYVVIPRGVIHRFVLQPGPQRWLWMEARTGWRPLKQYRNPTGQLRMDAPYTHRDFRAPTLDGEPDPGAPTASSGAYVVISKRRGRFTRHLWPHPPLDVVGWDGLVYPVVFPISRFSPKAGAVHLPPTVHGTFATDGALLCSFVPRTVDFGDGAIPCPYPHSSVDVDELIFYCDGDFTSRRGLREGSVSFHPAGVPHGPHPGAYEGSIGVKEVNELAVMLDTFKPLKLTPQARAVEDAAYDESWSR